MPMSMVRFEQLTADDNLCLQLQGNCVYEYANSLYRVALYHLNEFFVEVLFDPTKQEGTASGAFVLLPDWLL